MEELTAAEVDRRTDALLAEAEAEAGIDYAIAGAIALGEHGFKRLTVDVLRLIRAADLPRDFGDRIDPFVREKFNELWLASRHPEDDY